MKILFYCPRVSFKMGGAETFVRLLTKVFVERGSPTCILFVGKSFSKEFKSFLTQVNGRLQVHTFPCIQSENRFLAMIKGTVPSLPIYRRFFSSQYDWDLESLSFNLFAGGALKSVAFDLMSVHYYMDLALLKVDHPIAFHFHGIHPFPGATRLLKQGGIAYFACSHYLKRQVAEFHRIETEVIHNGVDTDHFRPIAVEKTREVLFMGRLYPSKGVGTVLALAESMPQVRFAIAGDGPLREKVLRAARSLPNLSYEGSVSYLDLPRLVSESRLLILPSRSDPFPLVMLEAMACGVPVVASRVGGIPEAVDETVGRLAAPDSPAEFRRHLSHLLGDRVLLEELGQAARRRCLDQFSIERVASQVLECYSRLAKKG